MNIWGLTNAILLFSILVMLCLIWFELHTMGERRGQR